VFQINTVLIATCTNKGIASIRLLVRLKIECSYYRRSFPLLIVDSHSHTHWSGYHRSMMLIIVFMPNKMTTARQIIEGFHYYKGEE